MKSAPLILLIVGLVVLGISCLAFVITILLVATSDGKIDPDEAWPGFGGGCCCSFVGLAMAAGGLIWWLIRRQQKA